MSELHRGFLPYTRRIQLAESHKCDSSSFLFLLHFTVMSFAIRFRVDEKRGRIVIFSVLDSIGKGGAHVAVQNMNLMFGLEETTALKRYGLHPY